MGAKLAEPGLFVDLVDTILHSKTSSTRKLYSYKWKLFTSWCEEHNLYSAHCRFATVLEFLQDHFSSGLLPSTLKVYVAAALATVIIRFLHGLQSHYGDAV